MAQWRGSEGKRGIEVMRAVGVVVVVGRFRGWGVYVLSVCREVEETYRVAALCSPVWQKRKRTSLRAFVNAYLLDIVTGAVRRRCGRAAVGVNWRNSGRLEVPLCWWTGED